MKWTEDLGAPLTVTAVDLISTASFPKWNEYLGYGVAALGYIGSEWGPYRNNDFVKNMGIAAFPWAAKNIYAKVRGGTTTARMSFRPAGSIATQKEPFTGNRLY